MQCLDDTGLARLYSGAARPEEISRADAHVDTCARCRTLLARLVMARSGTLERAATPSSEPARPSARDLNEDAPQIGRRYVTISVLGEGGMGRVYRALDRVTGRMVALKRVRRGAAFSAASASGGTLETIEREFRLLATLRHRHVISVLDFGFDIERRPYFTMELLEGAEPLMPLAASAPPAVQAALLVQLLRALEYLHRRGILHRDLKPSNLLVQSDAQGLSLKVLDFGLALGLGEVGRDRVAGTPLYMAPELLQGGTASEASDLYAAGVVAYEMLTGRHPFHAGPGSAPSAFVARALAEEPDLAPLPEALRPLIGRALCKSPSGRPAGATALLREVAAATGVAPQGEPAPESYLTAARLIGREAELDQLRRALQQAKDGEGSVWLIGGESGVGKSRLLEELRSRALLEGVVAVRGQALPGGTAYQVWRGALEVLALHVDLSELEASVLSMIVPNLGAILGRAVLPPQKLDAQATRYRLLNVLRDVIARSREPLLLLLEDLQWADAEGLMLLAAVCADLGAAPLLIVASFRDDEGARLPAELPGARALKLRRLDRPRIEALCEAMLGPAGRAPGLVDLVERETEGNTYFIVEVMRALAEESGGLDNVGLRDLPARILAGGVEHVLARRLARVPVEARPLLRLAAVAGRQLDIDVLSRRSPRVEDLIQACADAGVLEVHEQRWRFGHDKLRERVLGEIEGSELRELHAATAEALEATYGDSAAHAARIAHHLREAGQLARAAHYYALAGEAALASGALTEAESMLESARSLHHHIEAPLLTTVRVWRGLSQARFGLGRLIETNDALRRVCALAGAPLPEGTLGLAWALLRTIAEQAARRAGLTRHFRVGIKGEIARDVNQELLLGLSVQEVYVWLSRPDLLVLCTLRGLNLEEDLGRWQRTNFRAAMAFLLSYTSLRRLGRRYLDLSAANAAPGTQAEIDMLRVRAIVCINEGRWESAAASAQRASACARANRDDISAMHCLLQLQFAMCGLDDYPRVLEIGHEIERLAVRAKNPRYATLGLLGQGLAWIMLGDHSRAEAALDRAQAGQRHDLGPLLEAVGAGFSALCALQQGKRDRAEAMAKASLDAVERVRWTTVELRHALFCVLDVYLDEGCRERSVTRIRRALALLDRTARRCPFARPAARLFEGRYAWLRGRLGRAAAALRRSLDAAERWGTRYEQAVAHYWLGRLAQSPEGRRHIPEGAEVHLRAALASCERLGFAWEAARARAALRGDSA